MRLLSGAMRSPIFFINVRVYEKNGVYYTDPGNWKRLKLLIAPFISVELVAVLIEEEYDGWLAIPPSVKVVCGYCESKISRMNLFMRRIMLFTLIFLIGLRFLNKVRKAPFVGLLVSGPPIFYGGFFTAVLLYRPVVSIFIGSISKSYFNIRGQGKFPGLINLSKGGLAFLIEWLVVKKSIELFTAGDRLLNELGTGTSFSTSLISSEDIVSRDDTCLGEKITWIYSGAINYEKGINVFLEALHEIRKTDGRHQAILIGKKDSNFPVDTLINKYGLKDCVLLTGVVNWQKVMDYLRKGDIFVFLSLHEGMPKAPLEAMAQGLPVIATPTGADSYVKDGINGLIVAPGEVSPVVAAVTKIVGNRDLRRTLIANGLVIASEHTYDRQLQKLHQIICHKFPGLTDTQKNDWMIN